MSVPKDDITFLRDIIAKRESHDGGYIEAFAAISKQVHLSLAEQDSDSAIRSIAQSAIDMKVSDVHFDIRENESMLRFRIDGLLKDVVSFNFREHKMLVERLKYRGELKLNITHIPQDGKFRIEQDDENDIDIRISTLPTRYGESVVCRILDTAGNILTFDKLGIEWMNKRKVQKALEQKTGMILVTGPTGSGKTTTLYTLLNQLNTSEKKIITLEDPIEYEIDGITQSEISEREGYTFAQGVKAILRQDPDIIMVGEIRDAETAHVAMQAALTGHLVLSTLHTKSAVETIDRLLNMGLEPYNLAASLDIIISQRLVRRVCHNCGIKKFKNIDNMNPEVQGTLDRLGMSELLKSHGTIDYTFKKGPGCKECNNSGYTGRIGVYEVLNVTREIRNAIRHGASSSEIMDIAMGQDFITMREDGILKSLQGITNMEELFQVV